MIKKNSKNKALTEFKSVMSRKKMLQKDDLYLLAEKEIWFKMIKKLINNNKIKKLCKFNKIIFLECKICKFFKNMINNRIQITKNPPSNFKIKI